MRKLIVTFPSIKEFGLWVLFFLSIVIYSILSLSNAQLNLDSILAIMTFSVNIIVSGYALLSAAKNHSFSFNLVFWLFGFIFLGLAPLIQFMADWKPWGLESTEAETIKCNILITIWYVFYSIGRSCRKRFDLSLPKSAKNNSLLSLGMGLAVILDLICAITLIRTNGIMGLLFRGSRNTISDNTSLSILTFHVFRNTILYTFAVLLQNYKTKGNRFFLCFSCGALFFICCFPLGLSRYMAGAFYLGLLVILKGKNHCGVGFTLFVFLGLALAFPVLNIFRYAREFYSLSSFSEYARQSLTNTFLSANYDAHNMIIYSMQYTKEYGLTMGKQLLGALLFFVPRSIWPGKPIGSGAMIITTFSSFSFTNVSMPLVGEAYVNFGIVGVILTAIIIGIVTKSVDIMYWTASNDLRMINIIYPFIVFYYFFLLRGDMMSAGSYLVANVVMGYVITTLMTQHILKLKHKTV